MLPLYNVYPPWPFYSLHQHPSPHSNKQLKMAKLPTAALAVVALVFAALALSATAQVDQATLSLQLDNRRSAVRVLLLLGWGCVWLAGCVGCSASSRRGRTMRQLAGWPLRCATSFASLPRSPPLPNTNQSRVSGPEEGQAAANDQRPCQGGLPCQPSPGVRDKVFAS